MKGRKVTALFSKESRLEKILVEGNGESIYYVLDDKNTLVGMNRVECSKMNLNFEKGKIKRIAFIAKPDATLSPPKDISDATKFLTDFAWRIAEKPTKEQTIKHQKYKNASQAKPNLKPTTIPALQTKQATGVNKKPSDTN
jgi:hypothetical protein